MGARKEQGALLECGGVPWISSLRRGKNTLLLPGLEERGFPQVRFAVVRCVAGFLYTVPCASGNIWLTT